MRELVFLYFNNSVERTGNDATVYVRCSLSTVGTRYDWTNVGGFLLFLFIGTSFTGFSAYRFPAFRLRYDPPQWVGTVRYRYL